MNNNKMLRVHPDGREEEILIESDDSDSETEEVRKKEIMVPKDIWTGTYRHKLGDDNDNDIITFEYFVRTFPEIRKFEVEFREYTRRGTSFKSIFDIERDEMLPKRVVSALDNNWPKQMYLVEREFHLLEKNEHYVVEEFEVEFHKREIKGIKCGFYYKKVDGSDLKFFAINFNQNHKCKVNMDTQEANFDQRCSSKNGKKTNAKIWNLYDGCPVDDLRERGRKLKKISSLSGKNMWSPCITNFGFTSGTIIWEISTKKENLGETYIIVGVCLKNSLKNLDFENGSNHKEKLIKLSEGFIGLALHDGKLITHNNGFKRMKNSIWEQVKTEEKESVVIGVCCDFIEGKVEFFMNGNILRNLVNDGDDDRTIPDIRVYREKIFPMVALFNCNVEVELIVEDLKYKRKYEEYLGDRKYKKYFDDAI